MTSNEPVDGSLRYTERRAESRLKLLKKNSANFADW